MLVWLTLSKLTKKKKNSMLNVTTTHYHKYIIRGP